MRIPHGFSFFSRTNYKAFNEKNPTIKGTTMTQNQNDNILLKLEWETTFAAVLVTSELNQAMNRKK